MSPAFRKLFVAVIISLNLIFVLSQISIVSVYDNTASGEEFFKFDKPKKKSAKSPRVKLRSSYREVLVFQIYTMQHMSIRKKDALGIYGHSTIQHEYEANTIDENKIVIDNATGLMWHQSGSPEDMSWQDAKEWVKKLNNSGYARYYDWRLPTVEEAASLLEQSKKNGDLYIDPSFDKKQWFLLTGDSKYGEDAVWLVRLDTGYVFCSSSTFSYVRTVRSFR